MRNYGHEYLKQFLQAGLYCVCDTVCVINTWVAYKATMLQIMGTEPGENCLKIGMGILVVIFLEHRILNPR